LGVGENIKEAFKPYDQGNARVFAFAENEFGGAGQNSYGISTNDHEDNKLIDTINQRLSVHNNRTGISDEELLISYYDYTILVPLNMLYACSQQAN